MANFLAGLGRVIPDDLMEQVKRSQDRNTVYNPQTGSNLNDERPNFPNLQDRAQSMLQNISHTQMEQPLYVPFAAGTKTLAQRQKEEQERNAKALSNAFKSRGSGDGGGSRGGGKTGGKLDDWLTEAIRITGVPMSWLPHLRTIAMHESSGNPRAVNNWDINAKRGTPSKGLMQTIGPTFNSYKIPGYDDIWNPVHNAIASIRYIQSRYGDVYNVPGIKSMRNGGRYRGY